VYPLQGNDLTDFHRAGGDLRAWVLDHLVQTDIASPEPLSVKTVNTLRKVTHYPVTLRFPADVSVGVVGGQWQRLPSGEIEASFRTKDELAVCLAASGTSGFATTEPAGVAVGRDRALNDERSLDREFSREGRISERKRGLNG
jgi:hypothetical protein